MSWFVLGMLVLTVYVAVRLSASAGSWVTGSRFRAYRRLAHKYRGRYEGRGFSEPPTVSFVHKGTSVRVGLAPQTPGHAQPPRSRVVARFPRGLPFRMELAPASRPAPPQPPKGTRLVRLGDPEFDRNFVMQANDPEMARSFLSPAVRRSVRQLERLGPPGGVLLSISPERLLVQVDRNLAQFSDSLLQAVEETLLIHDGLLTGVASRAGEGIEIVEAGAPGPEDAGPPVCKVCGEAIVEPGVVCSSCRTPHHRDCWEFVGVCSIYGCNGKLSVPQKPTPEAG